MQANKPIKLWETWRNESVLSVELLDGYLLDLSRGVKVAADFAEPGPNR